MENIDQEEILDVSAEDNSFDNDKKLKQYGNYGLVNRTTLKSSSTEYGRIMT